MGIAHLDIDGLVWIGIGTMPSCLLDKLSAMDENECPRCIEIGSFDSADQLREDDLVDMNVAAEKGDP